MTTELEQRWDEIQNAGGPERFIKQELKRRGVYRDYKPNIMTLGTDREKEQMIAKARAEALATTELRQYVLEARKATHILHLGPDIFWNDWLKEDHFDPFQPMLRIQDRGLPILESVEDILQFLVQVVPELTIPQLRGYCTHRQMSLVYHYRAFEIPKKTGGVRKIWAPLPRLKAMQKHIQTQIVEKMVIHGSAHGFVSGKSILTNASEHTNSSLIVGVDLKDFFPTFTFARVRGLFRSYGYSVGVATLLAAICTEAPRRALSIGDETYYIATGPRVLPQGSPASPALTNALSLRLDRRLTQYADSNGWRYTRYADDLTFSRPDNGERYTNQQIKHLLSMLNRVTETEGVRINRKKTHFARKGCKQQVTGLIVNGDGTPRVPKKRRKLLRAALNNTKNGVTVDNAYTLEQLLGHSAFIYMTDLEFGQQLLDGFAQLLSED